MKRKLIEIAGSTFLVSLPRKWALGQNLVKGQELDVVEDGPKIIVSSPRARTTSHLEVDVSSLEKQIVRYKIVAGYILGYDEIKVTFENQKTLFLRSRSNHEMISTSNLIETISHELVGFEIIDHRTNHFVLKDLGGFSPTEFEDVFIRTIKLTQDLASDTYLAVQEIDVDALANIKEMRPQNIRKFLYYCLRYLNKSGSKDPKKTSSYYHLLLEVKQIISVYRFIARETNHFRKKLSPRTLELFKRTNALFFKFFDIFADYDEKKLVEIQRERNEIFRMINDLSLKLPTPDILLMSRLAVILNSIYHLQQVFVILQTNIKSESKA